MTGETGGPLAGYRFAGGGTAAADHAGGLAAACGAVCVATSEPTLRLVDPFGRSAAIPRPDGDPVIDWAASGALWLTGRRWCPPLVPPGSAASLAAGGGLLLSLLSRLVAQPVDVDARALLGERAAAARFGRRGPRSCGGATRLLAAADGPVALTLARPSDRESVPALVSQEQVDDPWLALRDWVGRRSAAHVVERAALLGIPAGAPPATPDDPDRFDWTDAGPRTLPSADPPRWRIVDLSGLWAGPLASQLLALAGAELIKVESVRRPDGTRRGPKPFFDLLHGGHRSVALDFGDADHLRGLRRLFASADLVIEAARPRALAQLGIGPADAGGSWLALRAYPIGGPRENDGGFGDDVSVAAGFVVRDRSGWLPVADALADPIAGLSCAVAGLAMVASSRRWNCETSLYGLLRPAAPADVSAPAAAARRGLRGWFVAGASAPVRVERPRARRSKQPAANLGADTAEIIAKLPKVPPC